MVLEVRLIRWLGPVSVLAGVLTMALAVTRGEASVYLVLIIPIIVGTWPSCLPGGVLGLCGFPPDVLVMAFPLRSGAGGSSHPARFLGGRTAGPSMGRSPFPRAHSGHLRIRSADDPDDAPHRRGPLRGPRRPDRPRPVGLSPFYRDAFIRCRP